jgi:hypothetical protein
MKVVILLLKIKGSLGDPLMFPCSSFQRKVIFSSPFNLQVKLDLAGDLQLVGGFLSIWTQVLKEATDSNM